MKKGKRILTVLLAGVLSFSMILPVQADEISDTKEKQEELKEQKEEAEQKKDALNEALNSVIEEMEKAEEDLNNKQIELIEAQDELDLARINESKQYESMKLRIKFMYENGDTEFIEILCAAESIGDFLNKAEYIQQISDYDRNMLIEFQNIVKQVEEKEAKLKEEEKELEALQDSLIEKQEEVETLLAETNATISDLDDKISVNAEKLEELIARAEEAKRQQQISSTGGGGGTAGASQIIGNGQLAWPTTSTRVTSSYGYRVAPVPGATSWHDAIDIGAPVGTPVYAADSGKVITAKYGYNGGRGYYVMIDHGNGIITRYQHLSEFYVSVGDTVTRGQNIAAVGNTGASSGPHLDFAVYVNGQTVDPMQFY